MRGTNLMVKSISLGILVTNDAIGIKKATDIQSVVHGRKIEVHDWETNCAFFYVHIRYKKSRFGERLKRLTFFRMDGILNAKF